MTAATSNREDDAADESSEGPLINLSEAPFAPVRWIGDTDFWKNVTVNVYSAAVVAVVTVTLVSVAQMVEDRQYERVFWYSFAGLLAIGTPPFLPLFTYGLWRYKHLPKKGRKTTVLVFAVNILFSLAAVSAVIVMGINNIIND